MMARGAGLVLSLAVLLAWSFGSSAAGPGPLAADTLFLQPGEAVAVSLAPSESAARNPNRRVKAESSDPTVAVFQDGQITALNWGEATVTLDVGGVTATIVVLVLVPSSDIAEVFITPDSARIGVGQTICLEPWLITLAGDTTSAYNADAPVVWSSTDTSVATVESGGDPCVP